MPLVSLRPHILAWALAIGSLLTGAARAADWSTLRIATEGAYPPFNYVDAQNQPQGFEIDLARALCERMKATCTFVLEDWDRLIPGLREGRFDAIMASLEITEERRQRIAFSRPYYRTPAAFMTRKAAPVPDVSPAGLRGRKIGAMQGSVYASFLEDRYRGSEIRLYANQDEASLDLALERIDVVLGDKIALAEWLKRGREASCCAFQADAPRDIAHFGEGYGVGLRKQDTDLRDLIDAALDTLIADGTYDRIRAAYWPFSVR